MQLVDQFNIWFFTFDRSPASSYINDSLESLHQSAEGQRLGIVSVVIDGPSADFVTAPYLTIRIEPLSAEAWETIRHWNVHRRIAFNYHRCFQSALLLNQSSGALICEDDVQFRHAALAKLGQVLQEMKRHGRKYFVLSLYNPHLLLYDRSLSRGLFYGTYPSGAFFGGQAVFFAADVIAEADEYWARKGWQDPEAPGTPNDFQVGRFGEYLAQKYGEEGGLYRCALDLVNHTGVDSRTGLGIRFHSSSTFHRPWNFPQ